MRRPATIVLELGDELPGPASDVERATCLHMAAVYPFEHGLEPGLVDPPVHRLRRVVVMPLPSVLVELRAHRLVVAVALGGTRRAPHHRRART